MPGQPSIQCISLSQAVSNILPHKELNQKLNLISWARQPSELRQKSTSMGEAKAIMHHGELISQGGKTETLTGQAVCCHITADPPATGPVFGAVQSPP